MARTPIHPGEHLAEALEEIGMSAAELARQLHIPTNRITGILNGERAVTADTALRLGHWFGTSAEFWLNLQKLYELRLAEQERGAEIGKLPRAAFRLTYTLKNGEKATEPNLWPMQRAMERGRQLVDRRTSPVSTLTLEGPDKTVWDDLEVRKLIRQHT
jgi:addiction module HigA family antidote